MLERYLEESKAMKKRERSRAPPSWGDLWWGDLQGEVTALQGYRLHFKQRLVDLQGKCLPSKHKDLSLDPQHACAKPGTMPIISVLKAGGGRHRQVSEAPWPVSPAQLSVIPSQKDRGEKGDGSRRGSREGNGVNMNKIYYINI